MELITTAEAAQILGMRRTKVVKYIHYGLLEGYRPERAKPNPTPLPFMLDRAEVMRFTELITASEAARILGITRSWLGDCIRNGLLKAYRPERDTLDRVRYRLDRAEVMRFLEEREARNAPKPSKICPGCKEEKPLDQFGKHGTQVYCRPCNSERGKRHYQANRERILERQHVNAPTIKLRRRAYYQANRARLIEKNHDHAHRRRARKFGNGYEPVSRKEVIERDGAICWICKRGPLPNSEIQIDHLIPLCKGGSHTYDNVAVTCFRCNAKKHDKMPDEVMELVRSGKW